MLPYLTPFPVHLIYYIFDCICVGLAWVGVTLGVDASIGVW